MFTGKTWSSKIHGNNTFMFDSFFFNIILSFSRNTEILGLISIKYQNLKRIVLPPHTCFKPKSQQFKILSTWIGHFMKWTLSNFLVHQCPVISQWFDVRKSSIVSKKCNSSMFIVLEGGSTILFSVAWTCWWPKGVVGH